MEGMLRIIQKRLRVALFFSRLVITYFFDQEIVVYANCAVHYFCQWEQWYWKFIYVLLSNACFPGMCCSVFCRQFYRSCFHSYIDVIMLVQIFSILLILFTWNQVKICFKICTQFYKLPMRRLICWKCGHFTMTSRIQLYVSTNVYVDFNYSFLTCRIYDLVSIYSHTIKHIKALF